MMSCAIRAAANCARWSSSSRPDVGAGLSSVFSTRTKRKSLRKLPSSSLAQCLRDFSWYLRLVTYGLLAGSTEMIQQIGLVGAREMYNSLGVPMPGMVESMRCLKTASIALLSAQDAALAGPYFDYLIQGMQTST